jgi:phosphoribosyl 1,2-cyclic phosphodiesterase
MLLKVIGSESLGNSYILQSEQDVLIIECGIKFLEVKKALDFDISKISGCLVSHEHGDHSKAMEEYLAAGISVYCSEGTRDGFKFKHLPRPIIRQAGKAFMVGSFKVIAFDVVHDALQPYGYIINHPEMGNTVFLTDSYYSKFKFANINHWLVEANYSEEIIDAKVASGNLHYAQAYRVTTSHMSIQTCKEMLKANDLSKTKNIVLIHLSSSNSDSRKFKEEVIRQTGINTVIADRGVELNLNLKGF